MISNALLICPLYMKKVHDSPTGHEHLKIFFIASICSTSTSDHQLSSILNVQIVTLCERRLQCTHPLGVHHYAARALESTLHRKVLAHPNMSVVHCSTEEGPPLMLVEKDDPTCHLNDQKTPRI